MTAELTLFAKSMQLQEMMEARIRTKDSFAACEAAARALAANEMGPLSRRMIEDVVYSLSKLNALPFQPFPKSRAYDYDAYLTFKEEIIDKTEMEPDFGEEDEKEVAVAKEPIASANPNANLYWRMYFWMRALQSMNHFVAENEEYDE